MSGIVRYNKLDLDSRSVVSIACIGLRGGRRAGTAAALLQQCWREGFGHGAGRCVLRAVAPDAQAETEQRKSVVNLFINRLGHHSPPGAPTIQSSGVNRRVSTVGHSDSY